MTEHACPQCKVGSLVERTNRKNGQSFLGCSRWRECKFAVRSLDRLAPATASAPASSNDELAIAIREPTDAIRALAESQRKANPAEARGIESFDQNDRA
jgi:ssDNA-binding Zn-finger/Zn-ribbon topoisomerase 1